VGDATGQHGFLKTASSVTTIDVPGANRTAALGINNTGQIVGYFGASGVNQLHGFVKTGSTFTTIDVPGAISTEQVKASTSVGGINDAGVIVGTFTDAMGTHGFVATPEVDTTPPVITIAATPATLWPPTGKMVPVTVSGTMTDAGSGVDAKTV